MQPIKSDPNAGSRLFDALESQIKSLVPETDPVDKISLPKPAKQPKEAKQ